MNKTKLKIIQAAIYCFNESGLNNVVNQEIATKADTSLSNFNYHFKTKKDLVFATCTYLKVDLENRIQEMQLLTKESHVLELCKIYFEFGLDFRFFYLDTHNILRSYPRIEKAMQEQVEVHIQIIKNLNYMARGRGLMKNEATNIPDLFDHLSYQIWINCHFWLAQSYVRGEEQHSIIQGLEAIYAICYPFLTPMGIKVFQNYIKEIEIAKHKS